MFPYLAAGSGRPERRTTFGMPPIFEAGRSATTLAQRHFESCLGPSPDLHMPRRHVYTVSTLVLSKRQNVDNNDQVNMRRVERHFQPHTMPVSQQDAPGSSRLWLSVAPVTLRPCLHWGFERSPWLSGSARVHGTWEVSFSRCRIHHDSSLTGLSLWQD
jgi:hypothetical protein